MPKRRRRAFVKYTRRHRFVSVREYKYVTLYRCRVCGKWARRASPGALESIIVDPRCTTCKRFCAPASTSVVYGGWDGNAESFEGWCCSRCGPFEPEILCWAGDL